MMATLKQRNIQFQQANVIRLHSAEIHQHNTKESLAETIWKYVYLTMFLWLVPVNKLFGTFIASIWFLLLTLFTFAIVCYDKYNRIVRELHFIPLIFKELMHLSIMLLIENGFIHLITLQSPWTITKSPALPDNIQHLLSYFKDSSPLFNQLWHQIFPSESKQNKASSVHFVTYAILINLSAFWMNYSGKDYNGKKIQLSAVKMGAKYIHSICFCHLLRTLCFMVTIIPSQFPYCAIYKFSEIGKRAPPTWNDVFLEQYLNGIQQNDALPDSLTHFSFWSIFDLRQDGGCNDLIFSGHFLVITCTLCLVDEICSNQQSAKVYLIKWVMVVLSVLAALDMIDKGHHYSIDVVLAIIIPILYWKYISFPNSKLYESINLPASIDERTLRTEFLLSPLVYYVFDKLPKKVAFSILMSPIFLLLYVIILPGT